MVIQIPNHAHCWVCGTAILPEEKTCSKECKAKMDLQVKKRKQLMYIMYGAMGLVFLVMLMQLSGQL